MHATANQQLIKATCIRSCVTDEAIQRKHVAESSPDAACAMAERFCF